MDCSLPGSSAHGILQARILEWVSIPSPGDLPDTGMEPGSPVMQADSLPLSYQAFPISELCHFDTNEYARLVTFILLWCPKSDSLSTSAMASLQSLWLGWSGLSAFLTLPLSSYPQWSKLCFLLGAQSLTLTGCFWSSHSNVPFLNLSAVPLPLCQLQWPKPPQLWETHSSRLKNFDFCFKKLFSLLWPI